MADHMRRCQASINAGLQDKLRAAEARIAELEAGPVNLETGEVIAPGETYCIRPGCGHSIEEDHPGGDACARCECEGVIRAEVPESTA
jgi:hypothetical protein